MIEELTPRINPMACTRIAFGHSILDFRGCHAPLAMLRNFGLIPRINPGACTIKKLLVNFQTNVASKSLEFA
jgi:hypothetical protein